MSFVEQLTVVEVKDQPDGSATIVVEYPDDFPATFMEFYGVEDWNQEAFEALFQRVITNAILAYANEVISNFEAKPELASESGEPKKQLVALEDQEEKQ